MRALGIRFASIATWFAIACAFHGCASQPEHGADASAVEQVAERREVAPPQIAGASPEILRRLSAKLAVSGEGWLFAAGTHDRLGWAGVMAGWNFEDPSRGADGAFGSVQVTTQGVFTEAVASSPGSEWPSFFAQFFGVMPSLLPDAGTPAAEVHVRMTEDGCRIRAGESRWLEPASPEVVRLGLARWSAICQWVEGRWCPEMRIAIRWESSTSDRIQAAFFDWQTWKRCEVVSKQSRRELRVSGDPEEEVIPTRKGDYFVWGQRYESEDAARVDLKALREWGMGSGN